MYTIKEIYEILFSNYSYQGWWPLVDLHDVSLGSNPTKTGSINGYHPNDYSFPKNDLQRFEICVGAILTQNTSWPQVEKALLNLKKNDLLSPEKIIDCDKDLLGELIRPAGYFNQKSNYLKNFAKFIKSETYAKLEKMDVVELREKILSIKGVGNETADSIVLYAFKKNTFVIDTYTKRICSRLGLCDSNIKYLDLQKIILENIKSDYIFNDIIINHNIYKIYNEFHALFVEHAKRNCATKPNCLKCILRNNCKYYLKKER